MICKRSCVFSPYARCNNYDILRCPNLSGHPCPVRFNIRQSLLPRVAEGGGFQVVMRNLRMRRLYCATSVVPCCALVSTALALYRWFRLHRQVYRFIPDFFSLFFSVPFSTRIASQTVPPPKLMFTGRAARILAAVWRTFRDCYIRTVEWESSFAQSGMCLAIKLLHYSHPKPLPPSTPITIIECNVLSDKRIPTFQRNLLSILWRTYSSTEWNHSLYAPLPSCLPQ